LPPLFIIIGPSATMLKTAENNFTGTFAIPYDKREYYYTPPVKSTSNFDTHKPKYFVRLLKLQLDLDIFFDKVQGLAFVRSDNQ